MKLNLEALAVTSFHVGEPAQADGWTSCTPECANPTNPMTLQQDTVLV
ncbi:MAG TPA: hypothetical protein VHG91_16935 [Longimicrobium sp.]|nr:hypothetical protein [Longimicrobium sp.]